MKSFSRGNPRKIRALYGMVCLGGSIEVCVCVWDVDRLLDVEILGVSM